MRLIPYSRQSRSDEVSIEIERQIEEMTGWAERVGVELEEPVVERSVSGAKPWRERELGAVVDRLEHGDADGIIVAYFSRLTREKLSATFEVLEALAPYRRVSAKTGRVVEPGSEIELVDVIESWQARTEWTTLSGHLRNGKHESWVRGIFVGIPPAGYAAPLTGARSRTGRDLHGPLVKNEYAETIGAAIALKAGGGSWSEVARLLTNAGAPTSRGETRWRTQACRAVLKNPIYKGLWRCTCGCGEVKVRPELAVVTGGVWEKAQPKPQDATPGRKDRGRSLLAGFLQCAECGSVMTHSTTGGGRYRFYRCSGGLRCSSHASISARIVEPFIAQNALDYFNAMEPTVGRETNVEMIVRLEAGRDEAHARLAAFVKVADPLDPGYEERLHELRAAEDESANALLAERNARIEAWTPEQVEAGFKGASVEEQRRLIRMVLYRATVTKGGSPVAERVEVEYKPLMWTPREPTRSGTSSHGRTRRGTSSRRRSTAVATTGPATGAHPSHTRASSPGS